MLMKTKLTIAAILLTVFANAQTLNEIIIKTENERYENAASDFVILLSKEASKGENYF